MTARRWACRRPHAVRSRAVTLGLALALGAAAAACGSDDQNGTSTTGSRSTVEGRAPTTSTTAGSSSTGDATTTTAAGGSDGARPLSEVEVRLTTVATLESPTALTARPGSSALYVAERAGTIRVLRPRGAGFSAEADPALDISADTTTDGERGLLGLAFSADGDTVYVSHTNAAGDSRLASYALRGGDAVDAATRKVLLAVEQPFANHNGGQVVLGPDGFLWFGLGDGGSGGDPDNRAQDPDDLLGKVLRIDPNRPAGGRPYGIPDGNPYARGGGRPEIYLSGVRNPWRFSFDRSGDDLWVADVGQNAVEEIDHLAAGEGAGANLGWSAFEGSDPYDPSRTPAGAVIGPVFEMSHDDGWCSVTGGVVYRGARIPALAGAYLFGDYCKSGLAALRLRDGRLAETAVVADPTPALVSINEDADGEVYLLSLEGDVMRLDPAG